MGGLTLNIILSEYEQMLIGNKKNISSKNFVFEKKGNQNIALTVFRYAIENLLQWDPKTAYDFFTPEVVKMMKLTSLLKYIDFPPEISTDHTEYIVCLLYPSKVPYIMEPYVIETYKKVIEQGIKYPRDFMFGYKGCLRARICLQYAMRDHVFDSIEAMYRFFASKEGVKFTKDKKLYQLFISSYTSPLEFVHDNLDEEDQNELFYHFYLFVYRYRQKTKELPPGVPPDGL